MSWVDLIRVGYDARDLERENQDLKEAICFLCGALVESEANIISVSRMCALERDRAIRSYAPVVKGIEANELIKGISKHAPDEMLLGVLKKLLTEKEKSDE
jgi:hypothetical protein